ncbi:hypothetical protein QT381_04775 [Galbitalea sp. SE-J8]|uniref:hypothetical protein n=1 Tax=Galbitalea sp. SE-J8 TaxID=3054952 RepID=UPI00259CCC76|nr:hypothetical protein [Galbitalea sp. SE-J8]MDM4762318.1 hypothetical protein [Galbitalea sp. SE-J8]
MSDDITVASPNELAVDTAHLLALASRIASSSLEARLASLALGVADGAVPRALLMAAGAPYPCYRTEDEIDEARARVDAFVAGAEREAALLAAAALAYVLADRAAHVATAAIAWTLGALVRIALPALVIAGAHAAAGWMITGAVGGDDFRRIRDRGISNLAHAAERFLHDRPRLTSNPLLAMLLRAATRDADEFLGGFAGVPMPGSLIAGDDETGWVDSRDVARLLGTTLPALGLYRESRVEVRRIARETGSTASPTLDELVRRLPTNDDDAASRVRVERYHRPGRADGFIVYIAGTNTWTATGSADPSDMTSNLDAMGGLSSGAERAAREAMAQAGVSSESDVVFVGHSQGGLIAHELAASGDYRTAGVFEIGSPADQVDVDRGTPDVRLVHDGDPVAALGGDSRTVDVKRAPWDDGPMPKATDIPVVAHDAATYEQTAALAQQSDDPRIARLTSAIASVTGGATSVTVEKYASSRVR